MALGRVNVSGGLIPKNSMLKEYIVASGQTIKSGELINISNNQVERCYERRLKTGLPFGFDVAAYDYITSCKIDEERIFLAYTKSRTLYMSVLTLKHDFISQSTPISVIGWSSSELLSVEIRSEKILIATLDKCAVITVNGSTLSKGVDFAIETAMSQRFDILNISSGKILIVFDDTNSPSTNYGFAKILNIALNDTITMTTRSIIVKTEIDFVKVAKINDTTFLCVYRYGTSVKYTGCSIFTLVNDTITQVSDLPTLIHYLDPRDINILLLDTNKVIVTYSVNGSVYQRVITVSGTEITVGPTNTLNVLGLNGSRFFKFGNKVLGTGYGNASPYKGYACLLNIESDTLVIQEQIEHEGVALKNESILFRDYMIVDLFNNGAGKAKIIRANIFAQGIAKTSGNAGESVKVYEFM